MSLLFVSIFFLESPEGTRSGTGLDTASDKQPCHKTLSVPGTNSAKHSYDLDIIPQTEAVIHHLSLQPHPPHLRSSRPPVMSQQYHPELLAPFLALPQGDKVQAECESTARLITRFRLTDIVLTHPLCRCLDRR